MSSLSNSNNNGRSMNGLNNVNANSGAFDNLTANTLAVSISATAPTSAPLTNNTNIATTAFVTNAISGAGGGYVDLTTNQNIGGIKTFINPPLCSTVPTTANQLTNKTYVDSVATGASLTGNNTFTGTNKFSQPVGVFDGSLNKLTLDLTSQTNYSSSGLSTQVTSGGTGFFQKYTAVPTSNTGNVTFSIPINMYFSTPISYTGNITLTFISVAPYIRKNGLVYSGTNTGTALLYNYSQTDKIWTGFSFMKPTVRCYLGNVKIAFDVDPNLGITDDVYDVGLILTATYAGPPIGNSVLFLTQGNSNFTNTNAENFGTFTGLNTPFISTQFYQNNLILSTNNELDLMCNNSLNLNSQIGVNAFAPNINLKAIQTFFAQAGLTGNFNFSSLVNSVNFFLNVVSGLSVFSIFASETGTDIVTTNRNLSLDAGTASINFLTSNNFNLPTTGNINMIPAGTLLMGLYSGTPEGYLKCIGGNVSRTTYARLFAAIGTNYGVGDGSTTFGIPDFQGLFPRMTGGTAPYIGGSLSNAGKQSDAVLVATEADNRGFRSCSAGTRDAVSRFKISTDPLDSGTGILARFPREATENRPANFSCNYYIRF